MPTVKLNLNPAGKGDLQVDGVRLSKITSGVGVVSSAGATKVTIDIGYCKLDDVVIEGADLAIKGDRIPESVQLALYGFLHRKYGHADVTVLGDDSRKYAPVDAGGQRLEADLVSLRSDVSSLQASVRLLCKESVRGEATCPIL